MPSTEARLRLAAPGPAERKRLLAGLGQPPVEAARFLLGKILVRRLGRGALAARIVETEAYLGEDDPAAHAYGGRRTRRTEPLWGRPGTLYVYFIYGMHHCLNLAVEPLVGLAGRTDGPGRLTRAFGIDRSRDGGSLLEGPLRIERGNPPAEIAVSPRIGVDYAGTWADAPLRFFDPASAHVSPVRRRR